MTESHIPLLDVQAEHRTVQDLDMELREAAVDLYSILHSIAWSRLEDSIEDESRFKNSKLLKDCVIDCDKAASTLFGFDNKSNLISVRTNTLGKAESFSNLMKRDGDEEIQTALGEDASGLLAGMARRVRSLASLPPTKMPAAITWKGSDLNHILRQAQSMDWPSEQRSVESARIVQGVRGYLEAWMNKTEREIVQEGRAEGCPPERGMELLSLLTNCEIARKGGSLAAELKLLVESKVTDRFSRDPSSMTDVIRKMELWEREVNKRASDGQGDTSMEEGSDDGMSTTSHCAR